MGYVFLAAAICIFGLMFSQGADGQAPQGPLVRDPLEAGGHWESSLSQADFVAIGEAIYMTKGSNTCVRSLLTESPFLGAMGYGSGILKYL